MYVLCYLWSLLMALDTTAQVLDLHVLVKVSLTGATKYYAERHVAMDDGNWYDGRAQIPSLRTAFQSLTEPHQQPSQVTLILENQDEGLDSDFSTYLWGNRDVEIRVGEGTALADYSLVFAGYVQFPAGITRTDDTISLTLIDARVRDLKTLPTATYDTTTFPNCDPPDVGRGVLLAYGDFVTASPQTLRAAAIDTTLNLFEVAGHTVGGISQVYRNGTAVAHSLVSTAPRGRFTLTTFTGSSDTVSARVIGKTGTGLNLAATTTLEHPMDILYDLLVDPLGVAATRIDTGSFTTLKNAMPTLKVRRVLDSSVYSDSLIAELANNVGFDVYVDGGSYAVKLREPVADTTLTLNSSDLVPQTFTVQDDPDRLFANRIVAKYNYDPANTRYNAIYTLDGTTSQTDYRLISERTLALPWHFQATEAQARAQRELLLFQNPIQVVSAAFKHRALLKKLTDVVNLDWSIYTDASLQVRGVEYDWHTARVRFDLWDVLSFLPLGRWTLDSAPAYYVATADQQRLQGFWTDDNGTLGSAALLSDTFTATNGTLLRSRLMNIGGTWDDDGVWDIYDGTARPTATTGNQNRAWALAGGTMANTTAEVSVTNTGGFINFLGGLVFRAQDRYNLWYFEIDGRSPLPSDLFLYRMNNNTVYQVGTTRVALSAAETHTMAVRLSGAGIYCDVDGTCYMATSNDFLSAAVRYGLESSATADLFEHFRVLPGTTATYISHWF